MDDPDAQYRLRIRSTLCDLGHVKPYFFENQPQGGGHVWETPIDGFHMYRSPSPRYFGDAVQIG